jgi:asparagine synthase (glutamine-hydrolysing)
VPLPPELQPTPLELAAGTVVGWSPPDALPAVPASLTPLAGLEDALAPALATGRCFVAFSGGRDSSAMLTAAVRAARQRGLAPPVPVSLRFGGAEGTDESGWQEELVAHLGLDDWVRIEVGEDLDMLGALSTEALRRHRLPWPGNGHAFVPLVRAARGGTLVTGLDGDGLLEHWRRWPAKAYAPQALRRVAIARRRPFASLSWLTDAARRATTRTYARVSADEPARWDRRVAWYRGERHLRTMRARMELHAADHGAALLHPLLDDRFLAALARAGGRDGYAGRSEALPAIFGDALPARIARRTTKAEFTSVYWGPAARRFAEEWDGGGVDGELVDPQALRAQWLAPRPDARSATMLLAAWLEREQRRGDVVE